MKSYTDLPEITREQIEHFFIHYKDLEPGKWVKLLGWGGLDEAHDADRRGDRARAAGPLTVLERSCRAARLAPSFAQRGKVSMPNHAQVLVVGAGPVGLTLANELVRHGISVRIVDKAAQRTDKSKALVLWSRSLELFDDAGYVDQFLPAGFRAHGAQVSNGNEVMARVTLDWSTAAFPMP